MFELNLETGVIKIGERDDKGEISNPSLYVNEKGEVKIEYQTWQAISRENQTFNCGTQVVVSEIIGNKLLVQQIKEIDIN